MQTPFVLVKKPAWDTNAHTWKWFEASSKSVEAAYTASVHEMCAYIGIYVDKGYRRLCRA